MINFKKMDDKDFVFISKPLSGKEEKEFSDFLKSRKAKAKQANFKSVAKMVTDKEIVRSYIKRKTSIQTLNEKGIKLGKPF